MLTIHYGRADACTAPTTRTRRLAALPARLWRALRAAAALRRARDTLGDLDDHILRDIGLTREQARAEAARSVWDAPRHWLR